MRVFLNLCVMSFPEFVNMTKNIPFFSNFARFCTPIRCTRVHCLVLKNNPNYVFFFFFFFFLRGWYPTSNTLVPPPGKKLVGLMVIILLYCIHRRISRGIMGIYAMDAMGNHPNVVIINAHYQKLCWWCFANSFWSWVANILTLFNHRATINQKLLTLLTWI